MHIYVENNISLPEVFWITEQMVRSVLKENSAGANITVRPSNRLDETLLKTADVFIGSGFRTDEIGRCGTSLKLVQCLTAGVEAYLPLDWLPSSAVFTNTSGVQAAKISMFGPMAVMMLNERIPKYATDQKEHSWSPVFSTAIAGKTALFYGFGSIGQAIATGLREMDVKIVAIRRSGNVHPAADETHAPTSLHKLLPRADFLVLCCPLTEETRGLIGAEELKLLPNGAGVLNIARAQVLDNQALRHALESGQLSGAIIDVFDPEPLPSESGLWDMPNLMILPHVSCDDPDGYIERCLAILGDNVERLVTGEPLRNVVDRALQY